MSATIGILALVAFVEFLNFVQRRFLPPGPGSELICLAACAAFGLLLPQLLWLLE